MPLKRLFYLALAFVWQERTGAKHQAPAGIEQTDRMVNHPALQLNKFEKVAAILGIRQIGMAADGAGG